MKNLFTLPWSDASLVGSALADRPEAFEELVARYQKKAHAIVRSVGVQAERADDVVQESFLRAFRELAGLRRPDAFGPWFLQIVRNAARDHLKRAARVEEHPLTDFDLSCPGSGPCEATEEKDFDEFLWRKVSELPQGIREAVFLYYHDGESTRSVAKTLGISRSNVKYRLQEGRNILRARLWGEMERSFREILGTERDWKRKARRLALVAMLCAPPSSALRATIRWPSMSATTTSP